MPKLVRLTPDEAIARENEADNLARQWINGNKNAVALKCSANIGLFADVVLCLGMERYGPDLLRFMASVNYEA